jgi:hypothetical protein
VNTCAIVFSMPPVKVQCVGCPRKFLASRKDAKWHSERCRTRARIENAKFETPLIPRSGVAGVTFCRVKKTWQIRIPEDGRMKYVGTKRTLREALRFREEVLNA